MLQDFKSRRECAVGNAPVCRKCLSIRELKTLQNGDDYRVYKALKSIHNFSGAGATLETQTLRDSRRDTCKTPKHAVQLNANLSELQHLFAHRQSHPVKPTSKRYNRIH